MFYGLAFLFSLGLLVFCVLDCIATDSSLVRNLPKTLWIMLIIFLPTIGSVAWLLLGRPEKTRPYPGDSRTRANPPAARPKRPLGPDDDPRFLEMTRNLTPPKSPESAEPVKKVNPAPEATTKTPQPAGEHGVNELKAWEEDLRRREEELRRRLEGEGPAGD
ncbi:MAG TPA: PLD nuclease N-terminal domain-containing protein [Actinomycetota bacterium]|nr:PLD nuclease N-terminal domain-containing protein [Actinomycetota bacterium]